VVRTVVLDNLREGVLVPDVYYPTLNPLCRDVLAHYGAVALPCRVRHPDRKGKVESAVGHAQKTSLKGLRFETLHKPGYRWHLRRSFPFASSDGAMCDDFLQVICLLCQVLPLPYCPGLRTKECGGTKTSHLFRLVTRYQTAVHIFGTYGNGRWSTFF
jgi:hypothetical protein